MSSQHPICPCHRWTFLAVLILFLVALNCTAQSGAARRIYGVVQDSSNAVINGATVKLKHGSSEYSAITGADGTFEFQNLSDEKTEMLVTAAGFAVARRIIAEGIGDQNVVITLSPQALSTDVQVRWA